MYALITGASSGIGYQMALDLANKGYDIIAVARREERLLKLRDEIKNQEVIIYPCDVSVKENCYKLVEDLASYDIEVFINNAGFGHFGEFTKDTVEKDVEMIETNVTALTILFNLMLDKFKEKNKGYILNVASAAAFTTGPLLGVYYATKSYVYKLTLSTYEELRRKKSKVRICVLCPGPVKTEFDKVADVNFTLKAQTKEYVSKYAIKKMLKHKLIIIPSRLIRIGKFFSRFLSEKMLAKIGYNFQKGKKK